MCRDSFLIPVLFRIRKKTCLSLKIWEQEVGDDLSICMMNILHKVSSLPSSLAINLMKIEIQIFQAVTWPHLGHLIKGSCLGASETMSAPSQYIFCRWRYVFYLSLDPTRPLRWDVMCIYGWELVAACHHPEKFGHHSHSDILKGKMFHQKHLITTYWHQKIELIG